MPSSAISAVVACDSVGRGFARASRPARLRPCASARAAWSISASSCGRRSPAPRSASSSVGNAHRAAPPAVPAARGACAPVRGCDRGGVRAASNASGSRSRSLRTRSSRASGFVDLDRGVVEHGVDVAAGAARVRPRAAGRRAPAAGRATATGLRRRPARERAVAGGDQAGGMGMAAVVGLQFGSDVAAPASRGRARRAGARASRCGRRRRLAPSSASRSRSSALQLAAAASTGAAFGLGAAEGVEQGELAGPDSRAWCSCWPWISTSRPASSASCASVTGRPLIQAREPPSARITRRIWQLPSSFVEFVARAARRGRGEASSRANSAASSARSAPWRTTPLSARSAGQQAQGVDQQRLAGAGFAGDHGQAAAEVQFRGADDGEILEGEVGEHGAGLCLATVGG